MKRAIRAVILLALAFLGMRLAKPHIQSYQFAAMIRDHVESQSVRPQPRELHAQVIEMGVRFGLALGPEDVTVSPLPKGGFEVGVHYNVPIDLIVYSFDYRFDFASRTRSAALPQ